MAAQIWDEHTPTEKLQEICDLAFIFVLFNGFFFKHAVFCPIQEGTLQNMAPCDCGCHVLPMCVQQMLTLCK